MKPSLLLTPSKDKPSPGVFVKGTLALLALLLCPIMVHSQEPSPKITVKTYDVRVIRVSKSGRVTIFEYLDESGPAPDRIILARVTKKGQNIKAFRALKTYPRMRRFAAGTVRRYPGIEPMAVSERYLMLEKTGESFPLPSDDEIERNREDLRELEEAEDLKGESEYEIEQENEELSDDDVIINDEKDAEDRVDTAEPDYDGENGDDVYDEETDDEEESDGSGDRFDPDLDTVGSRAGPKKPGLYDNLYEGLTSPNDITLEDTPDFDPDKWWLSVHFGLFNNKSNEGSVAFYNGGGARIGYNLSKLIFLKSAKNQDSLTAEAALSVYKVLNFGITKGDSFTIAPLGMTLRYNIWLAESHGVFFYTGFVNNLVLSAFQDSGTGSRLLGGFLPAFGAGGFLRLGPKWFFRLDAGFDMLGAGLILRF